MMTMKETVAAMEIRIRELCEGAKSESPLRQKISQLTMEAQHLTNHNYSLRKALDDHSFFHSMLQLEYDHVRPVLSCPLSPLPEEDGLSLALQIEEAHPDLCCDCFRRAKQRETTSDSVAEELFDLQTPRSWRPMEEAMCLRIMRDSFLEIEAFSNSEDFVTSGLEICGWREKRKLRGPCGPQLGDARGAGPGDALLRPQPRGEGRGAAALRERRGGRAPQDQAHDRRVGTPHHLPALPHQDPRRTPRLHPGHEPRGRERPAPHVGQRIHTAVAVRDLVQGLHLVEVHDTTGGGGPADPRFRGRVRRLAGISQLLGRRLLDARGAGTSATVGKPGRRAADHSVKEFSGSGVGVGGTGADEGDVMRRGIVADPRQLYG
ncbi:hypothetical protein ON010_g18324 [Phytophthora cinnamomi]|nr:hypothetical protein ON010_g18324 [Phytophthora cinnamomi]